MRVTSMLATKSLGIPSLQRHTTRVATVMLVAAYIMADISVYLYADRASHNHIKQTVLCFSAFCSICNGAALSTLTRGRKGLRECFDLRSIIGFLPVSASFCVSSLGLLLSFRHFDGAFIKLLGQMKLPLTAVLSWIILGRRYSLQQWQTILLIFVSCVSFTSMRIGSFTVETLPLVGLAYVLVWISGNILATLFAERVFKRSTVKPFPTMMCHLTMGQFFTAAAMLAFTPGFQVTNFFAGWDHTTFVVVGTMLVDQWLSALFVKRLSSLDKMVAKCGSLVFLFSITILMGTQPFVLPQALGALMIVESTALFTLV